MDLREVLLGGPFRDLGTEVDPMMEAASISASDQNIPWIARAKGFPGFRMAGNVLSTRDAIARALGVTVKGIPDIINEAVSRPLPFQVVEVPKYYKEVSPRDVPIPTYYSTDGGPYVTSGIFHAGYRGNFNLSYHRMMKLEDDRFAIRVVPRHLNALLREAESNGDDLPAAVSIGSDAGALIAGSISMQFGQDEMKVASSLHELMTGKPLQVFAPGGGEDGPKAPVGTEIVLLGRVTAERVREGPFVDITSTLDLSGMEPGEPIFEVDRVLVRDDPIVHVLLPGGYEHYMMMGLPKEPSILQSVRKVVPRVHAVRLTEGGCCWLHGVVSITKQKEGDGKNAIMAAFTGHPSMKMVTVVDEDIDIFDDRQVEWAVATRFQADRDLVLIPNARGSTLDPSSHGGDGTTTKMGIDATMPVKDRDPFRKVK
ncbi:MAG: UbiD family decarboxylase [Thermoplasmatota archaeon]